MNSLVLVLFSFAGYIAAYYLYGKFLGKKLFDLSVKNKMPSHEKYDGVDFVPTKKHIVFGHHFTTIAGLGPIVGPAIGVIWGWLPAFLWVFLGSIFMGAVHDFTTLVISARNQGKTIGDLTGDIISPSTRYAFQFIMQFLLFLVLSVFAMIVGTLFLMYPASVIPVWAQLPIAIWLGAQIKNGKNDLIYSIIALLLVYATIVLGAYYPVDLTKWGFIQRLAGSHANVRDVAVVTWCVILFIYVYIASSLPVQILLQPRDYINSHQLLVAMGLIVLGLFVAHPVMVAPAINSAAFDIGSDVPPIMPMLFIIIACGAISGFHSIASSGTTVKQVDKENDTLFIGYGAMLTESFLAVLVIVSVAGGIGLGWGGLKGVAAYHQHYSTWAGANGLGPQLQAFIVGAANLLESYGIPAKIGMTMVAVFIVSFANTTLDSATRMQRLSFQEIFTGRDGKKNILTNRFIATAVVVIAAGIMTFIQPGGKGALLLWPMFGALNQLLAALGLGVVTLYLYHKGKSYLLTFIPMLLILGMTLWAMINNIIGFIRKDDTILVLFSVIILLLTAWLLIGGIFSLFQREKVGRLVPDFK